MRVALNVTATLHNICFQRCIISPWGRTCIIGLLFLSISCQAETLSFILIYFYSKASSDNDKRWCCVLRGPSTHVFAVLLFLILSSSLVVAMSSHGMVAMRRLYAVYMLQISVEKIKDSVTYWRALLSRLQLLTCSFFSHSILFCFFNQVVSLFLYSFCFWVAFSPFTGNFCMQIFWKSCSSFRNILSFTM